MIPQARDDTYTTFSTKELSAFLHNVVAAVVGTFIGVFLSGIAVTLGVSSILLLQVASKRGTLSRRDYFLCAYTAILLLLLIVFEVQVFAYYITSAISFLRLGSMTAKEYAVSLRPIKAIFVILVVITTLTDGLLVLRCFLVQRALGHGSPKWGTLLWVFPACLWSVTVFTGIASFITGGSITTALSAMPLGVLMLTSNLTLNIYATLFITIRLLLHRRMIMTWTRDKALTARHIYIVGILLESAALNLPITAAAIVWFKSPEVEVIMVPTAAASQVLAAVLIIYQTALGRVFSREKEAEISNLFVETKERSMPGNVESIT